MIIPPIGVEAPVNSAIVKRYAEALDALLAALSSPVEPQLVNVYLRKELLAYLDTLTITGENIGDVRRSLFMPWDSAWNGIVRDETAERENRKAETPP